MGNPYKITYSFRFEDGSLKTFDILLSRDTLALIAEKNPDPPAWTELNNNKCANCSLDENLPTGQAGLDRYCPVALNLADIVREFKDYFSYENVFVTVTTEERSYAKSTTVQTGLSSLIGIIMVTSGCPVMEYMKPMVRFHLPFATLEETVYRMTSMFLVSRYFLKNEGKDSGCELDGLVKIFSEVSNANSYFAQRLHEAAKKDANINALVNLDCFAIMALEAEETLEEFRPYFSAYLK